MPEQPNIEEMYAPRYVRRAVQSGQIQKLPDIWRQFFAMNGVPKKLHPLKPWQKT